MSGHSKWSKIKRQKGAADAARGNLFTKLSKAISIAARGGGDPEMNFSLRLAIDKARGSNMPKDNIDRAIKRGTGEDKSAAVIEELIYEGFGPGGVGILIEALTDNRNRSGADIKHMLTKYGGSMAGPGAVKWQFEQKGVIYLSQMPSDDVQLELMDAGAADIVLDEGAIIYTDVPDFKKVMLAIQKAGHNPVDSGLEWVPKETVEVNAQKLEKIIGKLEELEDVQNVFTNAA